MVPFPVPRFVLILLLGLSATARAQEPAYLHYTIEEGLPSNEVYDCYEDTLGYTWFATDHGISRFDGYSFRNFSTGDGLVHNTVFGFYADKKGRVWMRTFNSALCYLGKDTILPWRHNAALQKFLGRNFIQRFAFDKAGNLWFVSINYHNGLGLYRQDAFSGTVERVKLQPGFNAFIRELDSGEIIAGVDRQNGYAAAAAVDDTVGYSDHTWLFRIPDIPGEKLSLGCVTSAGASTYVFTFDTELLVLNAGRITHRERFPKVIRDCFTDRTGQTWLAVNGFFPFRENDGGRTPLLSGHQPTSILQDRAGNFWFTTLDKGVFLARNLALKTLNRLDDREAGELLDLGEYNDLVLALSRSTTVFQFAIDADGIDTTASSAWSETFPGALGILCDPAHEQVVVTDQVRRPAIGKRTGSRIVSHPLTQCLITNGRDYALCGDSLLIAGNTGWVIIGLDGEYKYISREHNFSRFCTAIALHPQAGLWIGTSDGLYVFSGGQTIPFEPANPAFRQRVTDIVFGSEGEIFVSTRGGGLIVIDGDRRYYLRVADGLSSDQCGNICVDDSVLWVCSNNGLNRVAIRRNGAAMAFLVDHITTQHGLPSNMVNDVVRKDDLLFIATGKGLAWFDMRRSIFGSPAPAVYINTFLANNRETDPSATLAWNDNNITVGFIALLFRSPGNVNYRYRLEGYEQEWNYTNDRTARYFNLPPGDYAFAVSAMNENGVWNLQPATVRFSIPAHFTQTAWFRVSVILLIAGAASGLVFFFVRQQRNRARSGLALALAEQKALRAQMKPHFIFNSLNSIQDFILSHDSESAHLYLSRFSSLMRKTLENTQRNTISLAREIETLQIYLDLEKLRFGKNFDYVIDLDASILPDMIELPPMLIQPYAENAIWHGLLRLRERTPRLLLRFFTENGTLVCIVEDNGIGRQKAQGNRPASHISTGMKNIEERIAIINRVTGSAIRVEVLDLYGEHGEAIGTRIVLRIPSKKEKHENADR